MNLDTQILSIEGALAHLAPGAVLGTELEGGASTRRFFRIENRDEPMILMFAPAPSQEIAKARQNAGHGSFLAMRAILADQGAPVPRIYSEEYEQCILVEDLGPYTLAEYLKHQPEARQPLYQHAIQCIAQARAAFDRSVQPAPFHKRSFDHELLRWEVEHFRDWVFEAQGVTLSEKENQIFSAAAEFLAHNISQLPQGFVHRDYQSRNLMVQEKNEERPLVWIDFQDAMSGPRAYDLVALLTDSYQEFQDDFISARLREYLSSTQGAVDAQELKQLRYEFDLITVQRKLKDAGRFIFIDRVNQNPHFLQFVDLTIQRALSALTSLKGEPKLEELSVLIQQKLQEINS